MAVSRPSVRIVEVGPRDGLQNIHASVPTQTKIELIKRLYDAGLRTIEVTSVVSPKAIPQLADNKSVLGSDIVQTLLNQQNAQEGLRLPVLVPNLKGFQVAVQHGVREVAVFVSASEGFSRANINCSVKEGLDRARAVVIAARKEGIAVRGYISCIFDCPYDGPTPQSAVLQCVQELLLAGCYEISLGDTVGTGVAAKVKSLLDHIFSNGVFPQQIAGHFHDTYGQAVSNVWAAYQCGIRIFDSSVAGLGGCPFAVGAKGNVATEDLVYLFENAGIDTSINVSALVETGVWISKALSRSNESRAGVAIATKSNRIAHQQKHHKNQSPSKETHRTTTLPWTLISDDNGLLIHRAGPNVKVTLNRPQNGNALTQVMIERLTSFFQSASNDITNTRIALCASGKFFCTGMDLSKPSSPVARADDGKESSAQFERLSNLFEAISSAPQVTISCINGPAFGGGVGLALACDIRLAVITATVTLSEVKLGLCPATISKFVIRELGIPFAREAMLSARPISAKELYEARVVARVVDSKEQLSPCLDDYLTVLKASAPRASTLCKKIVELSWKDAGGSEQAAGIHDAFIEMMKPDAEAGFGLREFQAGRKAIDWDAYVQRKTGPKL